MIPSAKPPGGNSFVAALPDGSRSRARLSRTERLIVPLVRYRVSGWRSWALTAALLVVLIAARLVAQAMGASFLLGLPILLAALGAAFFFGFVQSAVLVVVASVAVRVVLVDPGSATFGGTGWTGVIFATAALLPVMALVAATARALARSLADRDRLLMLERRHRLALRAGRLGVYEWFPQRNEAFWDDTAHALFGIAPGASITIELLRELVVEEDRERFEENMARTMDPADGRRDLRYRIAHPASGEERWIHADGDMIFDGDTPIHLVGTVRDVTDVMRAQTERDLMLRELHHRVKNLFAVIQSIVVLSGRGGGDGREVTQRIRARIQALASANAMTLDQVTQDRTPRLRELLDVILEPHLRDRERQLVIPDDAPRVHLPPASVTPLGLVLHELATNAVKHGALRPCEEAEGEMACLHVDWTLTMSDDTASVLKLSWRERNVDPWEAPGDLPEPVSGGFGSRMIQAAARQFGGTVETSMEQDGLAATLTLPLRAGNASTGTAAP